MSDPPRPEETALAAGDRIIRERLAKLAADRGIASDGVACRVEEKGVLSFEYHLLGTDRSIALRARDIEHAAHPEKMLRFIEPRLKAVFEDVWWRKSVAIMAGRTKEDADAAD